MEKKWIKTEQMLEALKKDADNEQEYTHYLGGFLRSTHWLIYDSKKNQFGQSTNWFDYDWYTEEEFLLNFRKYTKSLTFSRLRREIHQICTNQTELFWKIWKDL